MKNNVTKPGGLHTDNAHVDQPKNTVRFALNAVNESNEGEVLTRSNEESNEQVYQITPGYIPLGQTDIGEGNKVIFSVAPDESASEIGVVDKDSNYTVYVNADLGFKIGHQIDATFRLRRGCERTVYWVDPKPRVVNLDGLDDYKDNLGNWYIPAFNLMSTYNSVPVFSKFEIGEEGVIEPCSINFAVQYLDSDFNPTEWMATSDVVKIYNDTLSKPYNDIRGSSNKESDFYSFGNTNKSVKITLSNLDTNFPFYRIGIIKANTGSGRITQVEYSPEIPTQIPVYNYTGQGTTTGSLEEIQQFANIIDSAQHISQIENKLILSNVKGKQVDFCKLQKYASRVKADVVFKEVILNNMSPSNPKSPTADTEGTGYMPGEIESFGLVYVFDDGTTSPVYHIPGRNPNYVSQMSDNNQLSDTFYTDNETCDDYWGLDSEGEPLVNKPVRHHRFPLRTEVNKLLYTKEGFSQNLIMRELVLEIRGELSSELETITFAVTFTSGGITDTYQGTIDTASYDPTKGLNVSIATSNKSITVDKIYENTEEISGTSPSGLTYTGREENSVRKFGQELYKTEIFGIKFSGIERPSEVDTNGNKVVGYYIVKNERTDENKTILDSGVLSPMVDEEFYVGHGFLAPNHNDNTKFKKDAFAIIHPEHKFLSKEHKNTSEILQQGEYVVNERVISRCKTQDALAGTSYDPEVHKRKEKDNDGFTLHIITRDHAMDFRQNNSFLFASNQEIDEIMYLDALSSKVYTDTDGNRKELFNVSGDNKIGIITTSVKKSMAKDKLPYVVLRRNLSNPYANFRYLPYYKQSKNINTFFSDVEETTVFAGDTYVTPLRYSNSVYYNTKPKDRKQKSSFWNYIVGGLAIIAGALITIGTLGGGTALGVMVAGFGISQIASGLKKDKILNVYNALYDAGLRNCVTDNTTRDWFDVPQDDDEVQWLGDTLTNLWFESSVNMSLRQGVTINSPDFLNAPDTIVEGDANISTANNEPVNELDKYFLEKLSVLDPDAGQGRLYRGHAVAEIYDLNLDYLRKNQVKIYNHLGIEYDCCSDCNEVFPNRTHWSETSFQEELTDNYRVFLPNNYRDIEGQHGPITAIHRIAQNLYIHCSGALWHLPQNYQERVTGDILSFIGTGEFFNIPPRRIVDDAGSAAGTRHKWGCIKTKHGILFPSADDLTWYLFNGNELKPITDVGNSRWFRNNMPFVAEQQYYKSNRRPYPFNDNPVSRYGIGFLSVYDDDKKRLILTKKDFSLTPEFQNKTDYEVTQYNGELFVFENYEQTITGYRNQGYSFDGIKKDEMRFVKQYYKTVEEERVASPDVADNVEIHIFKGNTSRDAVLSLQIDEAVNEVLASYDSRGKVYRYDTTSERFLDHLNEVTTETYAGQNLSTKQIVIVSFTTGGMTYGNMPGLEKNISAPDQMYLEDFENFKILQSQYGSFKGLIYPIAGKSGTFPGEQSQAWFQKIVAAMKGRAYTSSEFNAIPYNRSFTVREWNDLKNSVMTANPYPDDGLEQYGYQARWYMEKSLSLGFHDVREKEGSLLLPGEELPETKFIDARRFDYDIKGMLTPTVLPGQTYTVTTLVPVTVFDSVKGIKVAEEDFIEVRNNWTISYSLKENAWISWHSYAPNFYFRDNTDFYSWIYGNDYIWRHNKKGHYQTFYGQYHPHIIEYVSVSSPVQNRIWDSFMFQTQAQRYVPAVNNYVDDRFITFNKMVMYNSRQISGELFMRVQDSNDGMDYLEQQISNRVDEVLIDNNEGDWYVNGFRDMRGDYSLPIFKQDIISCYANTFTDKVVNNDAIDFEKDWSEMESFRDKYLGIRLIFDTFDNVKLVTNYSVEVEDVSAR